MDLKIIEIASHTENQRVIKNYTHQSKNKNPLCGDEMEISLIVKDNIIEDIGYQCKSCIYCQASVSLLSRFVMQAPIEKITDFLSQAGSFFDESFDQLKKINIKGIGDFKKIMNSKNISRKECLLLPFKTLSKALKL
jgi:nitrogen fixation protein NifU and related proteins|tara:strand:- start:3 stop:413 length:411 start_codon:yes stop_codon:yes gene_type:complete